MALTLLITVSVHRKKNSKMTQKKKTRNHRSSKFYTHTHSNLKIFSRVITKNNLYLGSKQTSKKKKEQTLQDNVTIQNTQSCSPKFCKFSSCSDYQSKGRKGLLSDRYVSSQIFYLLRTNYHKTMEQDFLCTVEEGSQEKGGLRSSANRG